MLNLLDELRAELVARGLVRYPNTRGEDPSLPPLWLHPRDGVPAPGAGQPPTMHPSLVLGAFLTGGTASVPYVGFLEQARTIDVRLRAKTASDAIDKARQLEGVLDDQRHYMLGQLLVEQSLTWRPAGLLGSDDQGYDFVMAFAFDVRRASYAA